MCYADLTDYTPEQIAAIKRVMCLRFAADKALPRNHSSQPPVATEFVRPTADDKNIKELA